MPLYLDPSKPDPMITRLSAGQRKSPVDWIATPEKLLAFFRSEDTWRVLLGPNQGGKTVAAAREAIYMSGVRPHPFRRRYNEFREWSDKPTKGWLFARTVKQSVTPQRRIYDLTPPSKLVTKDFNEDRGFLQGRCEFTNGSWIKTKTADQDPVNHASDDLDWIWPDEPWDKPATANFAARLLARKGSMFGSLTPVDAPIEHIEEAVASGVITAFRFSLTVDNCHHLSQRDIDDVISKYGPEELAQRVHALWRGPTKDRACPLFSDVYVDERGRLHRGNTLPMGWVPLGKGLTQIIVSIDYGEIGERTVATLIARRGSRTWVLASYASSKATTLVEDAWAITDMLASKGLKLSDVDLIIGDTNTAGKLRPGYRLNDLLEDELSKIGRLTVPVRPAVKGAGSIERGTKTIDHAFGRGDLLICEDAPHVLNAVRHWKGTDLKDDRKYKHAFDTLRYGYEGFDQIGGLFGAYRMGYRAV